jgi:hypothetical protein
VTKTKVDGQSPSSFEYFNKDCRPVSAGDRAAVKRIPIVETEIDNYPGGGGTRNNYGPNHVLLGGVTSDVFPGH